MTCWLDLCSIQRSTILEASIFTIITLIRFYCIWSWEQISRSYHLWYYCFLCIITRQYITNNYFICFKSLLMPHIFSFHESRTYLRGQFFISEGLRGYGVWRHFQQYFSSILAVSFIGGGNRSTWRKPLNCRKSHSVVSSTPRHERNSNSHP